MIDNMCLEYDDSMADHPFFQEIQKNYENIIQKAITDGWIICVPKVKSLQWHNFSEDDIFENILVPYPKSKPNCFRTLTNKNVHVENKAIKCENNVALNVIKNIEILYEETFYLKKDQKYVVWCISNPINAQRVCKESNDFKQLNTLHDCIVYLKRYSTMTDVLKLIERECEKMLISHTNLETESLQNLRDIIKELFLSLSEKIFLYVNLEEIKTSHVTFENFKLSLETYMHFVIYKNLFWAVCNATAHLDSNLNKIIRNNSHLECKDFEIDSFFHDYISSAKFQLNRINIFNTILDKVNCLKSTFKFYKSRNNEAKVLSADDFLNITVFIIIKSSVYNWIANVTYITQFLLNNFYSFNEKSFFVTTLEAAVQHIQNKVIFPEKDIIGDKNNDKFKTLTHCIKSGNFENFLGIFESTILKSLPETTARLCHPLCSCDFCENILKNKIDIDTTDEKGWSLLHTASYYGRLEIIERLINFGANVNQLDFMNNSPMHFASIRGHQDVLLLLLHSGSDVNAPDYNGNTPLHLSSYNGHESCVKALLYSKPNRRGESVKINWQNNTGDTALHLASKLGFIETVNILLQYGANARIKNSKKFDAVDLAQNFYVKQMIVLTTKYEIIEMEHCSISISKQNEFDNDDEKKELDKCNSEESSPVKKVDLVLKAIENNDLPLMCFYLGIPSSKNELQLGEESKTCHPLCLCEKCRETGLLRGDLFDSASSTSHGHVNLHNSEGYTPLHVATKYGRSEMVRLLLDSGASINVKTKKHLYSPLHIACLYQRMNCVKELLQSGACDVDVQDANKNTPLHCAVFVNNAKIVEILLAAGTDVTIKNVDRKTPQQEANKRMLLKISKLFETKSEKTNDSFEFLFQI